MITKIIVIKLVLGLALILYLIASLFIFLYSIIQSHLTYSYIKRKSSLKPVLSNKENDLPMVTIQLPVYNEKYVISRLIDAVALLEYPSDSIEIQILDDSTDETSDIIEQKITEWKARGINIIHLKRKIRDGYKAGALKNGLATAKGEFVAIFDADFLPPSEFLLKTIPYFSDSHIGMVQTRWEHLNKRYSLLTGLQAFALDAHFSIEQSGRNKGGNFINFNGTAGIWRKSCIIDAGNWQSDTLTEDLDLSYRAQLKKWKFVYVEDVSCPAELPPVMSALKTQQYRWTKGGAEVARKQLSNVFHSSFPFKTKIHALFHLLNGGVFLCVITCAILSVPMLFAKHYFPELKMLFWLASFFLLSFVALSIFYWISFKHRYKSTVKAAIHYIYTFPLFLSVSMGLSLHNAIAAMKGYTGKKTPFIRTPKFNITDESKQLQTNRYSSQRTNSLTIMEGILALYFLNAIVQAFRIHDFGLMPFHIMLTVGFSIVFCYSVFQSKFSSK